MIKLLIKVALTITAMYSNSYAASAAIPPREPIPFEQFISKTEEVRATLVTAERRLGTPESPPQTTLIRVLSNSWAMSIAIRAEAVINQFWEGQTELERKALAMAVIARASGFNLASSCHFIPQAYAQNVALLSDVRQCLGDFIVTLRDIQVLDPTRMITFRSGPIDIAAARDRLSIYIESEQEFSQNPRQYVIQVGKLFEPLIAAYLNTQDDEEFIRYSLVHQNDPVISSVPAPRLRLGVLNRIAKSAYENFGNLAKIREVPALTWTAATEPARAVLDVVDDIQATRQNPPCNVY
jgi:hypothetical protein